MIKKLLSLAVSAFLLGVVGCSDDNPSGVPVNSPESSGTLVVIHESSSSIAGPGNGDIVASSGQDAILSSSSVDVANYSNVNGDAAVSSSSANEIDFLSKSAVGSYLAFDVAENGETADVSDWDGICVTYDVNYPFSVYLKVPVDILDSFYVSEFDVYPSVAFATDGCRAHGCAPTFRRLVVPDLVVTRCVQWKDFTSRLSGWDPKYSAYVSKVYSGEEAAKNLQSLIVDSDNPNADKGIKRITKYDSRQTQINKPIDSREYGYGMPDDESPTCLWNGLEYGIYVNTGFSDLDPDYAGLLSIFLNDGESTILYPVELSIEYSLTNLEAVVFYCEGFCGQANFYPKKGDYDTLGVFFSLIGYEKVCKNDTCNWDFRYADIQDWGGLCITYYSEKDAELNILVKDAVNGELPKVSLPKTEKLVEKCFAWNDFAPQYPNMASAVGRVQFEIKSNVLGEKTWFNIVGIGKYAPEGACPIQKR